MKTILLFSLTLFANNSFAAWTEIVECAVVRGSVDELTVVSGSSAAQLNMSGLHNGETGEIIFSNDLIPSYSFIFSKVSNGRTDEAQLVTKIGDKIVALSSVDTQQNESVSNRFITENGDYQITVTCSSKLN